MRVNSIVVLVLISVTARAQLRLPAVIGDGMVLQRETSAPIWGWAKPGETVSVVPSWDAAAAATAVAGGAGEWIVRVKTPAAGGPHTLAVSAGSGSITLTDVLVGEVWLCSGQSNMEMPVGYAHRGYAGVKNWKEEVAAADHPKIRLFNVTNATSTVPLRDCAGSWVRCSPQSVGTFSGTAYFFGRDVQKALDVPVGLIEADWGGTPAEAWTSEEGLKGLADFADAAAVLARARVMAAARPESRPETRPPSTPGSLYNGMIAPLVPYAIRGAIWYQGESNRGRYAQYRVLFPAMIADWRRAFGIGDFPFYYVQIAPYEYKDADRLSTGLREAQLMTLRVPNTGMVVTTDVGNAKDIHPNDKQEVGRRLSLWALAKTYGRTDLVCSGPLYRSMKAEGESIRVEFDSVGGGLVARGGALRCFEIAGDDRKFVPAEATIEGTAVVVRSPSVANPGAVRFASGNAPDPNLFNAEGLPASPFRTDDWPLNE